MLASVVTKEKLIATYIAMAMGCFGAYTLLLALIPAIGLRNGLSPFEVGVLTATLTGFGLITDLPLAHISRLYGSRIVVLCGAVLTAFACSLLYYVAIDVNVFINIPLLWTSAIIAATGFSCMIAPLLGGIASHAQGAQVPIQALNSIAQRIGAFAASGFLGYLFASDDFSLGPVLALAICVLIFGLARNVPAHLQVITNVSEDSGKFNLNGRARISDGVKRAILISISIQFYLIAGYVFFPVVLENNGIADSLGLSLTLRELVAVISTALIGTLFSRYSLPKIWATAAVFGLISMAVVPFLTDPVVVILVFSIHGVALGIGIMAGNVHTYFGTTPKSRIYGFAYVVMSTRLAGIVVPILLGGALEISKAMFSGALFLSLLLMLFLYLVVDRK
ncbi:MAG: hypothetical protein KDJ17_08385 [Hyphomicrobiaceae bacterium]|nr:hypothetical protein [Hyphomicrobiaceae bacterium]